MSTRSHPFIGPRAYFALGLGGSPTCPKDSRLYLQDWAKYRREENIGYEHMVILPPESGKYLGVGVQLAASFLLFMFIGYYADKKWASFPLWTTVGSGTGIALGFYNLYIQLTKRNGK